MTRDYLHLRLLVNGFKLASRSKYTLWDDTYHERDEEVFFKPETFALFGFYDVCASDDQISSLYSSEFKKTEQMQHDGRNIHPENVLNTKMRKNTDWL